ncbi:MAG: hypothetical protein ACLQAH_01560 [Limisphaerales bacterium]
MIALCQSDVQIAVDQSFAAVVEPGKFVQNTWAGQFSTSFSSEAMRSNSEFDEAIVIPQEMRGQPLSCFSVSVRLGHIFEFKKFRLLGELHGLTYDEIAKYRNCGRRTIDELQVLVRKVQQGESPPPTTALND